MVYTGDMQKIMLPLIVSVLCFSVILVSDAHALSIIPGENENLYGMTTPAGSGRHLATPVTNICKVTNLRDSGTGSLRHCIEDAPAPKTIVFEVSGNIELQSNITFGTDDSYTTVAGQTAPSPGITLKHYGLRINGSVHDVLIQHIRIRPGDTGIIESFCPNCAKGQEGNPIVIGGTDYFDNNIVIDHTSLSWGGDMTFTNTGSNLTAINNLLAEPLHSPLHSKGPHSKGFYNLAYSDPYTRAQNVAFVKNMITHSSDRSPAFSAGSGIMANNYIYDSGGTLRGEDVDTAKKGPIQLSIVGNRVDHSTRNPNGTAINFRSRNEGDGTKYYISEDNMSDENLITDPWNDSPHVGECFNWGSCTDMPASKIASTREDANWPAGYETMPVSQVKDHILANAGARPADRDPVDIRLVNKPATGEGHIIQTQDDVGGWPELDENVWKLTPPTNPDEVQSSGYTKLEEWLHQFSDYVEGVSQTLPAGVSIPTLSTTPTPSVRILANTASIAEGFSVKLTWESVNTDSCTASEFSTGGATEGSVTVTPSASADFTVTCTGPGGDASDTIFVRVVPFPAQSELVAHFDMEEGSGTATYDVTSNNHAGNLTSGVTWITGHTGNGLDFNDEDGLIETDVEMGNLSTFTATAWIYPRSLDEREGVFSSGGVVVHYNLGQYEFRLTSADSREICKIRKGGTLPVLHAWNFIAFGYDGESCFIHFRDAYQYGGDDGLDWQQLASGYLKIGRGNGSYADSWFDGVIDDVRIYNYALSESELEALKSGNALPPPEPITFFEPLASSIVRGSETTLNWTSSNAVSCTGTNFSTDGETRGSAVVSPDETTTYTLTCISPSGTTAEDVVVHVYEPPAGGDVAAIYYFDEGAGEMLFDSSGEGNHATIDGAVWVSEGYNGAALEFDGMNDVAETTVNLTNYPTFTVTGWFNPNLIDGREGVITGAGLYMNYWTSSFGVNLVNTENTYFCGFGSLGLPELRTWNFIAVSYNGDECALHYLGNYQSKDVSDGEVLKSGKLRIGRGNPSYGDSWFEGMMDEVRVYNRALNQVEIETLRDITTPPPVGTYACNDGVDNDGDGFTDYPYDTGCISSVDADEYHEAGTPSLAADFNKDSTVNIFDYNLLITNFGITSDCDNPADANRDCSVNIFDYNILLGEFGTSG